MRNQIKCDILKDKERFTVFGYEIIHINVPNGKQGKLGKEIYI